MVMLIKMSQKCHKLQEHPKFHNDADSFHGYARLLKRYLFSTLVGVGFINSNSNSWIYYERCDNSPFPTPFVAM
jgi:hypothetical protein